MAKKTPQFYEFFELAKNLTGKKLSEKWILELWTQADSVSNRAMNYLMDTPDNVLDQHLEGGSAGSNKNSIPSLEPPGSLTGKKKKRNSKKTPVQENASFNRTTNFDNFPDFSGQSNQNNQSFRMGSAANQTFQPELRAESTLNTADLRNMGLLDDIQDRSMIRPTSIQEAALNQSGRTMSKQSLVGPQGDLISQRTGTLQRNIPSFVGSLAGTIPIADPVAQGDDSRLGTIPAAFWDPVVPSAGNLPPSRTFLQVPNNKSRAPSAMSQLALPQVTPRGESFRTGSVHPAAFNNSVVPIQDPSMVIAEQSPLGTVPSLRNVGIQNPSFPGGMDTMIPSMQMNQVADPAMLLQNIGQDSIQMNHFMMQLMLMSNPMYMDMLTNSLENYHEIYLKQANFVARANRIRETMGMAGGPTSQMNYAPSTPFAPDDPFSVQADTARLPLGLKGGSPDMGGVNYQHMPGNQPGINALGPPLMGPNMFNPMLTPGIVNPLSLQMMMMTNPMAANMMVNSLENSKEHIKRGHHFFKEANARNSDDFNQDWWRVPSYQERTYSSRERKNSRGRENKTSSNPFDPNFVQPKRGGDAYRNSWDDSHDTF